MLVAWCAQCGSHIVEFGDTGQLKPEHQRVKVVILRSLVPFWLWSQLEVLPIVFRPVVSKECLLKFIGG